MCGTAGGGGRDDGEYRVERAPHGRGSRQGVPVEAVDCAGDAVFGDHAACVEVDEDTGRICHPVGDEEHGRFGAEFGDGDLSDFAGVFLGSRPPIEPFESGRRQLGCPVPHARRRCSVAARKCKDMRTETTRGQARCRGAFAQRRRANSPRVPDESKSDGSGWFAPGSGP